MMKNMANIPFIEHKAKLFKEQRRLKSLLVISNLMWLAICCVLILR